MIVGYPDIDVRLTLNDRLVDLTGEEIDVALRPKLRAFLDFAAPRLKVRLAAAQAGYLAALEKG